MKKIMNQIESYVDDMMEGMLAANPNIERVEEYHVLKRKTIEPKVTLVSGGGSGHEPAHAGFLRSGMLDVAVLGQVFTSPTPDQVLKGIQVADQGKGVLLIIKNYTGDVMNFEMAAEMAEMEGITVEKVVVADDVAVENSTYTIGRRGIAGTLFVHKIAGMASLTQDLSQVKRIAKKVIANTVSIGMSLSACTVPAAKKPNFVLAENEVEVGLGIHGEPGVRREALKTAHEHVQDMLAVLDKNMPLTEKDEVAILVNGLGATPLSELYIVNKEVNEQLKAKGIQVIKNDVGTFMSALDMQGFSISILKLDDELKTLILADNHVESF